jgi:hypothetical protein
MDDSTLKASRIRRRSWAGAMGVVLTAVAFVAAGCGGDDEPAKTVASAPTASGSSASPTSTGKANPVAYAQCMRENGLPNFPDPMKNGAIKLDPNNNSLDPNSPEFKKAHDKCKHYMGAGGGEKMNQSGEDLWPREDKLKYAECMRAHGEPDFPDPRSDGQFPIFAPGGSIDPQSDQFKKADDACKSYKPGLAPGPAPGGQAGGGPAGGGS